MQLQSSFKMGKRLPPWPFSLQCVSVFITSWLFCLIIPKKLEQGMCSLCFCIKVKDFMTIDFLSYDDGPNHLLYWRPSSQDINIGLVSRLDTIQQVGAFMECFLEGRALLMLLLWLVNSLMYYYYNSAIPSRKYSSKISVKWRHSTD